MKIFYCLAIFSIVLISCNSGEPKKKINPNIDAQSLFMAHCASCHKCDVDFTGPALKGAESRWKDKKLLYEFRRNPMAVVAKDEYAAGLMKKYNSVMTPSMLTDEEIDAVLNYCDQ
jgi:cytochrome c551/c552